MVKGDGAEMLTLEKRIRTLEDIESIKRLKADYCFYADIWNESNDRGSNFGALFAADGVWDVGHKRCTGPREIAEELMSLPLTFRLKIGIHLALNPRIDLDGDCATGTWHLLIPVVPQGQRAPHWNGGMYFEKYARTPDGWRFKDVRLQSAFVPPA